MARRQRGPDALGPPPGRRRRGPSRCRSATSLSGPINPHFEPLIRQHASQQGIRADLVRAVIQVESAFNPRAVSPKGAMGLMQLMPATAEAVRRHGPVQPGGKHPRGRHYLRQLLDRYDDNEQLALAAYNAGPGAVDKHGSAGAALQRNPELRPARSPAFSGNVRAAPGLRI